MSVINQVLNQLEQRGVHTVAEQPMVRAVQHGRRSLVMPLLVIALILAAGVVAWQWVSSHKPAAMVESVQPKTEALPGPREPEKLTSQRQPAEPSAPAGQFVAASKLSFELSSAPLPSSLRSSKASASARESASRSETKNPAANPLPDIKPGEGAPVATETAKTEKTAKSDVQAPSAAAPMKRVSTAQQADAEFRRAAGLMQQGRIADAIAGYEAALRLEAGHEAARQALVALLLEGKRNVDAERVLQEGLNIKPEHTGFTMLLARLQAERGALELATATLEKSLQFAEAQADYRAFLAALLQRQNRNEEAIAHYQIVLQHAPSNGIWLMGYGISLHALKRDAEAREAFKRAIETKMLSPELQAFVQAKLKEL